MSPIMRREVTSVSTPSKPYPTSMRMRLSSLAIRKMAPLSLPFWPIFQASARRIEYSSIDSGLVVGTISTTS